jgi:hypothetical protein
LAAATSTSTEALGNSTLCDDIAACQRNCDRHAEEETRAKPPQKIEKDELRQKEYQTVQSMQENQGVGLPSTPQALILCVIMSGADRMRSHFFVFMARKKINSPTLES